MYCVVWNVSNQITVDYRNVVNVQGVDLDIIIHKIHFPICYDLFAWACKQICSSQLAMFVQNVISTSIELRDPLDYYTVLPYGRRLGSGVSDMACDWLLSSLVYLATLDRDWGYLQVQCLLVWLKWIAGSCDSGFNTAQANGLPFVLCKETVKKSGIFLEIEGKSGRQMYLDLDSP